MVRNQAYGCIEQVVFFLGAVLLEIRYGSVPPGSPNSEPILGEKNEHVPFHIGFQSWPRKSTLLFRPGARFSKAPLTFRARKQIFKSKYRE